MTGLGVQDDLVTDLGRRIEVTLRGVLGQPEACVLVGFPLHGNVGDHAIWLGERSALRRLGVRVERALPALAPTMEAIRHTSSDHPLLVHGGGNVGDTWPEAEALWEALVLALADRRIVFLPQTVYFRDRVALTRARRVFGAHPDLTFMVRDERSLAIARERLEVRAVLCPDMGFAIGAIRAPSASSRQAVVWLARRDREARGSRPSVDGVNPVDWWDPIRLPSRVRLRGSVAIRASRFCAHRARAAPGRVTLGAFDATARYRLARGVRLLGAGQVVITDRLHGHILSLLMGIPHIVLDNSYGKNRAFYETWTSVSPLVRWASSPAAALVAAKESLSVAP